MMECSNAQRRAITHNKGPALVIAGPGSGKTFVITQRIRYLITHHGISPEKILVITFTKAAALEMKERAFALLGAQAHPIAFGTFHSVFFHMLKISGGFGTDSILREKERRHFLSAAFRECGIEAEKNESIEGILSEISSVKSGMADYQRFESKLLPKEQFRMIYIGYERMLTQNKKLDFDDMIRLCFRMLKTDMEIQRYWQERFSYLLIDEYQDVNRLQAETVKLLLSKERNLFVVGDDDQAIYGFRGADPSVMLSFQKEYEDASMIMLDRNYRSDAYIVNAADRVIGVNTDRFSKKITASKPPVHKIDIQLFEDEKEEYGALVKWCRKHKRLCRETAVIVRTNREIGWIARYLKREHISFSTKERVRNLYDSFPGSDILAYLRLAAGIEVRQQFFRVMNKPVRFLARNAVGEGEIFPALRKFYLGNQRMTEEVNRMEKDLAFLKKLRPYAAFCYIMKGIGYGKYLDGYCREHGICMEEVREDLWQVEQDSRKYKSVEAWIQAAVDAGSVYEGQDCLREAGNVDTMQPEGICLCTMHGSKGLEYDTVFLPNVNEGVTPYRQAKDSASIEEERRMFYVAMTRAKKQLHIWTVKNLNGKEVLPSRFLEPLCEISEDGHVSSDMISSYSMSSR